MASRKAAPGAIEYSAGLAERLRIARKLVEPRQVDAARRVACEPGTWFRYERGYRDIDTYTLARFCIQYDVDPKFILLGDPSGLRWPLVGNLRLIPEATKYFPEPQPGDVAPASRQNTPRDAMGTKGTILLARLR